MAAKKSAPLPAEITLRWSLAELPSSQHRAGLAGLILMIDWRARRTDARGVCEIVEHTRSTLGVRFDAEGMQSLFDEAYAASFEEILAGKPYNGKDPKRVDVVRVEVADKKGNKVAKSEKRYVYDAVVPSGAWLAEVEPTHDGKQPPWLKLWRDFVWSILRGVPATRGPFESRAERAPTKDGKDCFSELVSGADGAVELPSTYSLGAQSRSADLVPVLDRARFRLLLHFWPFVARIYVPALVDEDGRRDVRGVGFAVAIPDINDLLEIADAWREMLLRRSSKMIAYRPEAALVDLPGEAALNLVHGLRTRLESREGSAATTLDLVEGVDVVHCEKEGNNVRVRGVFRVTPTPSMMDEYDRVGTAYRHPLFRQHRLRNVLAERAWWHGYDRLFVTTSWKRTVSDRFFRDDVKRAFETVEVFMSEDQGKTLESIIYQTVGSYLSGRVKSKHGIEWSTAKESDATKREYGERREKIAKDAFLAVRARTGADFVSYFTGTICSVSHRIDEESFNLLARELMSAPEKVRTLTLLALSARA